jgi:S-adenosylmethionine-dependent methyltransferase
MAQIKPGGIQRQLKAPSARFPVVPQEGTYQIVRLANGVHSVRSVADDEVFHPVVGPVAEAEALYVRQVRLTDRLADGGGSYVVWDVGLGAAANALTVLRAARPFSRPIHLVSFDQTTDPLRFALENRATLGYLEEYQEVLEEMLARGRARFRNGSHDVLWDLVRGDFPGWVRSANAKPAHAGQPALVEIERTDPYGVESPHLILYDAFSPAKNPAMWTLPVFQGLFARLARDRRCLMPTYSRSTLLRVTLLLAGFHVGAGHATGEKEETTIAANSLEALEEPLPRGWLDRVRRSRSAEPLTVASYIQRPLSAENWRRLLEHPQFR